MDNKYKWAVEDIFKSVDEWEKEFNELSKNLDFSIFKGKLSNPENFLECMKKEEEVCRKADKLSVYAMMKHDENTKDALYDSLSSKVTAMGAKLGANTAYIMPELTALSDKTLRSYIEDADLSEYDYFLQGVLHGYL